MAYHLKGKQLTTIKRRGYKMIKTLLSIKIETGKNEYVLRKKFTEIKKEFGIKSKLRILECAKPVTQWTDDIKKKAINWMQDNKCDAVAVKVDGGFLIGLMA
jgi:hypothetical protein